MTSGQRYRSDGLLLLISAILFYLAGPNIFCKTGYAFTAWIFAVPLFFVLDGKSFGQRLRCGALFSMTAYLLILSWVANVNVFLFIFFAFLFAVQPVIFAVFFRADHARPIVHCLFLPALWVLSEALRTFLIGGYAWTIGHSQTFVPVLIQIADLTGAYGISFAILLVNTCLFLALRNQKQAKTYCLIAALVFGLVVIYGMIQFSVDEKTAPESFSVCTIQPDITSAEKFNPDLIDAVTEKHIKLVELCAKKFSPDLIIWPETAITDDFLKDPILNKRISALSQKVRTPMLIGAALLFNNQNYNSAVLLDRDGKPRGFYHKQYLLPFNEYFPLTPGHLAFFKRHFHIRNH
ncbi:MAG TPA: apolipoprotein N-acyltransferase, partial [Candidatus Bathyarchaeia archaeon]|nr:apolipoprotein N-acyltransferase [Candidatus Bathyarchaeia archaeon]